MLVSIRLGLLCLLSLSFGHAAAASLSGTIFANGGALPDVQVTLSDGAAGGETLTAISNADGEYAFDVDPGNYLLDVQPPADSGFGDIVIDGVSVDAAGTLRDIFLITRSNTLSGTTTLPDGQPVPDARITVYTQGGIFDRGVTTVTTDAQGRYRAELSPGEYALHVQVNEGNYRDFDIPIGNYQNTRQVENIDLSMDVVEDIVLPYVSFSGRTLDSNGVPVSGVEVYIGIGRASSENNYSSLGRFTVRSDEQGEFSALTPPGTYDIDLKPPSDESGYGITSYKSVDLTTDTQSDLVIESANTLSGTMTLPDGQPVPDARITVYTQGGIFDRGVTTVTTDAQGRYRAELSPGEYALHVQVNEGNYRDFDIPIGNYQNTRQVENIDLSMDVVEDIVLPYVSFSGRTLDSNGVPVSGVEVYIGIGRASSENNYSSLGRFTVRSDEQGEFSALTPPGTYDIDLKPPSDESGYGITSYKSVDLTTDTQSDLVIESANTLSGTMTLPDGQPVPDARITVYTQGGIFDRGVTTVTTDAQGHYRAELSPGEYALHVQLNEGNYRDFDIPIGNYQNTRQVENIDLSMDVVEDIVLPHIGLSGRTLDSNGVPVSGVEVYVGIGRAGPENNYSSLGRFTVRSDEQGKFSALTPPGTYPVGVLPPEASGFGRTDFPSVDYLQTVTQDIVLVHRDETVPRLLAGPIVSDLSANSATVSWLTDEPATSSVIVDGIEFQEPGFRTEHSVSLTDLQPVTRYDAVVASFDASGNGPVMATSDIFETTATPDTDAPIIVAGPDVSGIDIDSAIVRWTTNEPAFSTVQYTDSSITESLSLTGARLNHEIVLSGLTSSTSYSVQIEILDAASNGPTISDPVVFETSSLPDLTAPVIVSGPLVTDVTDTEATIVWRTDEPASSGISLNDGERYTVYDDESLSTDHSVRLTGLTPDVAYLFTVSVKDTHSNGPALSEEGGFITLSLPDEVPPALVDPLKIVGVTHQSAVVHWRTDEPSASLLEFGTDEDELSGTAFDAKLKNKHVLQLTGLLPATRILPACARAGRCGQ